MARWRTWREATTEALYGPDGFFRTQAPAEHFRTSVHVSTQFAAALLRLARSTGLTTVVDVGAGRGELLAALHDLAPDLTLVGVELADRPSTVPAAATWTDTVPHDVDALIVANEWLDNVPVDVAEVDPHGTARIVEVDVATGNERLGPPVTGRDAAWLDEWWPLADAPPGSRGEIGWPRDDAWADVVRRLRHGVAVAIDYGHLREERPWRGTLTAYRSGRVVSPVPDTSCDITSHVAVDAVAHAGECAGAQSTLVTRQRDALRALGVSAARPPHALAHTDPRGYLAALARSCEASELVDAGGLGGFWWVLQARDVDPPAELCRAARRRVHPSSPARPGDR
ncbi:SAM-dependent methyltransferase [Thermasporomyces composti]|jgi:SAM-dependent MidA family methyltransferase|uniref:SAM-dependent MidA family methyltransferase n=1 Tax=Thermasporomyces composti TaxID=696763 RepID=A0A3D9V679_THECX|nr:SAM-dependent methyltransferase [Thermasporomyces composti]REF37037.1 SAM-dependent MidA family methyltransferase [Thermasporomyces composti]